jgi:hypothetical protein
MGWGYNNFGELGVGDTDIRLQPTKITAFKNAQVIQVSCGERHSAVVTSHIPLTAKEDATLKPYFKILEVCLFISEGCLLLIFESICRRRRTIDPSCDD